MTREVTIRERPRGGAALPMLMLVGLLVLVASFVPNLLPSSLSSYLPEAPETFVYSESHFVALLSELNRVRRFEDQLSLKASQIESLIQDAAQLDFDAHREMNVKSNSKLGVGGGDIPRSSVITYNLRGARQVSIDRNIVARLNNQIDALRAVPIGYPVAGEISSGFGTRYLANFKRGEMHSGVDLAVEQRTPVVAVADGIVIHAGYKGAYGRMILIDHGSGFETLYGHLERTAVKVGQPVCRGERIGYVGMTGRTTGPHLHYEVRLDGKARDPVYFLDLASYLKEL